MRAVFDTNILVDHLNGHGEATEEMGRYETRDISIITWMEVLIGTRGEEEERVVRRFLNGFGCIGIAGDIAEEAVELRRGQAIKLPDALIWASARTRNALLVTRNTKDFPRNDPGIRVPYQI